ncbi:hypothetical protein AA313_de0201583 [Arthrobotrys entomopaga]|nr:hypothetical protein AA313_de0201583 [Arthrobotrys entomopaga]
MKSTVRRQCALNRFSRRCILETTSRSPRLNLPSKSSTPTRNAFQRRCLSSSSNIPGINTCPCSESSESPDISNLDIDQKTPIAGVITRHYRHVLIHTGTINWPKRLENDEGSIAANLKPLTSGRGMFVNPFYPILVSNVSFPSNPDADPASATVSVFPEGIEITSVANTIEELKLFVKSFLLPSSSSHPDRSSFITRKITKPMILACSHGSRDERCGILGPSIAKAFEETLSKQTGGTKVEAIIGEISHIGGHKFAGNIIIHLPADHDLSKVINSAPVASSSPLAGLMKAFGGSEIREPVDGVAIWYGRVMPYHAEGIVETTLRNGKIVKDLLRGIVNSNGELIDLRSTGLTPTG